MPIFLEADDKNKAVDEKESLKKFLKGLEDQEEWVKINEGHVSIETFSINHERYEMSLKEIKDKIDLLQWVRHLTEKVWMSSEKVNRFITVVCKAKGWDPYNR